MIRLSLWRAPVVLAYMAGIVWLSSLPGSTLGRLGLEAWLANLAHLPLFAGLGALSLWALEGRLWLRAASALAVGFLFGLSDEWHQTFVPGRVFSVGDLAFDALGLALGVWSAHRVQRSRSMSDALSKTPGVREPAR